MREPSSSSRQAQAFLACAQVVARYIRRRVRDADQAADVFQEVSLLVLRTQRSPGDDSCFVAWCMGLAKNTLSHHFRAQRRRTALLDRAEPEHALLVGGAPLDPEQQAVTSDALWRLLGQANEPARQLMLHRYLLGMSADEIAAATSTSPAAVRMRLMRARAALLRRTSDG